jgi:hypothetical protein
MATWPGDAYLRPQRPDRSAVRGVGADPRSSHPRHRGPGAQAQRLRTLPTGIPGTRYGLGILDSGGWIGHNGSIPGYQTVTL